MTKQYADKLHKATMVVMQEIIDGCPECSRLARRNQIAGKICITCEKACAAIILRPKESKELQELLK